MKALKQMKEQITKIKNGPRFWDRLQVAVVATFWVGFIVSLIVMSAKHPPKDISERHHMFTPSGKFY